MLRFGSHRFGSNRATHLKSPKNTNARAGCWIVPPYTPHTHTHTFSGYFTCQSDKKKRKGENCFTPQNCWVFRSELLITTSPFLLSDHPSFTTFSRSPKQNNIPESTTAWVGLLSALLKVQNINNTVKLDLGDRGSVWCWLRGLLVLVVSWYVPQAMFSLVALQGT